MGYIKKKAYVGANIFLNAILYDASENPDAQRAVTFLESVKKEMVHAITSLLT